VAAGDPNNNDIWVHDLARAARTRLTLDAVSKHVLTWSPSGDQIAFVAGGSAANFSIWLQNANGTGEAQKLVEGSTPEFSPDGKLLVYAEWKYPDDWDLWFLPLAGERKPVAVVQGSDSFDVSADGKRFVVLQPAGTDPDATAIMVVENWFAEFRNKK